MKKETTMNETALTPQQEIRIGHVNEVAIAPVESEAANVGHMLQLAIEKGLDADTMEKLVGLYERIDDRRAAREFSAALLRFQASAPVIGKNRSVQNTNGSIRYHFTSIDYLLTTIRDGLQREGISFTQDTAIEDAAVYVVTILRHVGGHREQTSFRAPIDSNASMNAPQKVASAVSYGRRYGLMLALGLVTGEDDDAERAGNGLVNEEQVQAILTMITESGAHPEDFLKWMKVDQVASIAAKDYNRAMHALRVKKMQKGAEQ